MQTRPQMKERVNFSIHKSLNQRIREIAELENRKYSNLVEICIKEYLRKRDQLHHI